MLETHNPKHMNPIWGLFWIKSPFHDLVISLWFEHRKLEDLTLLSGVGVQGCRVSVENGFRVQETEEPWVGVRGNFEAACSGFILGGFGLEGNGSRGSKKPHQKKCLNL